MTRPNHRLPTRRWAGRPTGLLLALLVLLATVAACSGRSDDATAPAASPTPAVPTPTMPPTAAPPPTTAPSRSTAAPVALPQPIREVRQGDHLFGVYWVAVSLADLSPVERRLQALGYPPSSGELDCDRGARRWLGSRPPSPRGWPSTSAPNGTPGRSPRGCSFGHAPMGMPPPSCTAWTDWRAPPIQAAQSKRGAGQ